MGNNVYSMNKSMISFVVYSAKKSITLLSSRAYRPLHCHFLHPHGNYSSPYPNHYKLTLI